MAKAAPKPAAKPAAKAPAKTGGSKVDEKKNGNPLLAKRLKAMKDRWQTAKDESKKGGGGGTTLLPGDRYVCNLTDARIVEKEDWMGVVLEYTCVDGDQTGEKGSRMYTISDDEKIISFQRDLRKLGVEVDDFDVEELPNILEQLIEAKPLVRITVKENGEYINVWLDKVLDGDEAGDAGAGEAEAGGDDAGESSGDDAGSEGEGVSIDVGDTVKFTEDDAEVQGTITKVKGSVITVTDADGGKHIVDTEDTAVEKVEEDAGGEAPADELEVGSEVSYKLKGKKVTGMIKKDNGDGTFDIRNDDTKQTDKAVKVDVIELLAG